MLSQAPVSVVQLCWKKNGMDFLKANGAKIAIALILFGVAGALYWSRGGGSDQVPSRRGGLQLVCVETGYTTTVPHGKGISIPYENPNTGRKTMLPAYERDGQLLVNPRHRDSLAELQNSGLNKVVDAQTFVVNTSAGTS